jgi:hypothetical protein
MNKRVYEQLMKTKKERRETPHAGRERSAVVPIKWFDHPEYLAVGSRIRVVGVASDASQAVKDEWGQM